MDNIMTRVGEDRERDHTRKNTINFILVLGKSRLDRPPSNATGQKKKKRKSQKEKKDQKSQ